MIDFADIARSSNSPRLSDKSHDGHTGTRLGASRATTYEVIVSTVHSLMSESDLRPMNTLPPISVDAFDALQIIRRAASFRAEEIQFTAFRPANEMGVRFKKLSASGRVEHVSHTGDTYKAGFRTIKAIFGSLCEPSIDVTMESLFQERSGDLSKTLFEDCGLSGGSLVSKPIRDGRDAKGFIVILSLSYATAEVA